MPKVIRINSKQKIMLIAAVRMQKCLHDPKNVNLRSNLRVWSQVAAQCGITRAQTVKVAWIKIRDAYISHKKNPNRTPNKIYSIFFKHMTFFDQYIFKDLENKNKSNEPTVENCRTNTEIKEEPTNQIYKEKSLNNHMNEITTNGEFTTIQFWNDESNQQPITDNAGSDEFEANSTVKIISESGSEFNSDLEMENYEDAIIPEPNSPHNKNTSDETLKLFFNAMFASTVKLPQVFQRIVKRKIFAAVLEAEEESDKQKKRK